MRETKITITELVSTLGEHCTPSRRRVAESGQHVWRNVLLNANRVYAGGPPVTPLIMRRSYTKKQAYSFESQAFAILCLLTVWQHPPAEEASEEAKNSARPLPPASVLKQNHFSSNGHTQKHPIVTC